VSAPLIWVLFPLGVGMVLLLARTTRGAARVGAGVAFFLALLAWKVPIGEPVRLIGDWGIRLTPTMHILGRQLVLPEPARPLLVWVYLGIGLWLAGAAVARMEPTFVGLGLGLAAALVAALAVRPFLYAALIIETAALLNVPLLSPPGSTAGRGLLRFLTFQTLGMLFILLTGWMLVGTETSLPGSDLALRASVLLGVGLALLLGVFPFHSWIPMLTEEIHPYASALVITAVTSMVGVFGLMFLERYTWLRESAATYQWLQVMGAVMVVVGGLLALFQRHAGRVLGYGILFDEGLALFALGIGGRDGVSLFFALWPARMAAFLLWALALSGLGRRRDGLTYRTLRGVGRAYPWLAVGAVVAPLTVAGMPWLAGFPTRMALWQNAAALSPSFLVALAVGSLGLVGAAFRLLGVLTIEAETQTWRSQEQRDERLWMWALMALLVVLGLFPQIWWAHMTSLFRWFPHLTG